AGDNVSSAVGNIEYADRAYQRFGAPAALLDKQQHLGCGRGRILAMVHGYRAGVPGQPFDVHDETVCPSDRRDDTHREPLVQQYRALLDVDLDVTQDILRFMGSLADSRR